MRYINSFAALSLREPTSTMCSCLTTSTTPSSTGSGSTLGRTGANMLGNSRVMKDMDTCTFLGKGVKPMEGDSWLKLLERNFEAP